MANRTYLYVEDQIIFESSNTIPLFWLMGFDAEDAACIRKFFISYQERYAAEISNEDIVAQTRSFLTKELGGYVKTLRARRSYMAIEYPEFLPLFELFVENVAGIAQDKHLETVKLDYTEYLWFFDGYGKEDDYNMYLDFFADILEVIEALQTQESIKNVDLKIDFLDLVLTTSGESYAEEFNNQTEAFAQNYFIALDGNDPEFPKLILSEVSTPHARIKAIVKASKSKMEVINHLAVTLYDGPMWGEREKKIIDILYYLILCDTYPLSLTKEGIPLNQESFEILNATAVKGIKEKNIITSHVAVLNGKKMIDLFVKRHDELMDQFLQESKKAILTGLIKKELTVKGAYYVATLIHNYDWAIECLSKFQIRK